MTHAEKRRAVIDVLLEDAWLDIRWCAEANTLVEKIIKALELAG